MKNKKIVFYGAMSVILTSVGGAFAAQIASKEYVDSTSGTIVTNVSNSIANKADKSTTLSGYGITDAMTTTQINTALTQKADTSSVYTKPEIDTALGTKADSSSLGSLATKNTVEATDIDPTVLTSYAKTADVNTSLGTKANTADVNTALATKADVATTYTKTEVDTVLGNKADSSSLGALATKNTVEAADIDPTVLTSYAKTADVNTSLANKEDSLNKSLNITADTGSTIKYATVSAIEGYAVPKPPANCLGTQSQCVLAINKSTGAVYWEDVAMPLAEPQ